MKMLLHLTVQQHIQNCLLLRHVLSILSLIQESQSIPRESFHHFDNIFQVNFLIVEKLVVPCLSNTPNAGEPYHAESIC